MATSRRNRATDAKKSAAQEAADAKDMEKKRKVGQEIMKLAELFLSLDKDGGVLAHLGLLFAKNRAEGALGASCLSGLATALRAENCQWLLRYAREYVWPEGAVYEKGADITEQDIKEAFVEGRRNLSKFVAGLALPAKWVITERMLDKFFEFLQIETLVKQFFFEVLEDALLALFPELRKAATEQKRVALSRAKARLRRGGSRRTSGGDRKRNGYVDRKSKLRQRAGADEKKVPGA